MKKIALFVEGETEAEFVEKLLREVANRESISFERFKGAGKGASRVFTAIGQSAATHEEYRAHIYISSTDNRVNQDIKDQLPTLKREGFDLVVGLRDLRGQKTDGSAMTLADLPKLERANVVNFGAEPNVRSIIAVMEIETWFLSETTHFERVSPLLSEGLIRANIPTIGVNPYEDDLTLVIDPAETLHRIYYLAGLSYHKRKNQRNRTIKALDMAYVYIESSKRLVKLGDLVKVLYEFLT